jgi:hypothetical protein
MGKARAIAAIEPIKGDTVFVADSVGRIDGKRPSSGLILAISVLFQTGASCEFCLTNSKSLASVAESRRDILGCPNVRTPFLTADSP